MATNNQEVEIQSRWKSRYYEALGEIEDREKSWREAERLLRHVIMRLTLAADNRHRELTLNLTELRNAVRDGRDIVRLRELIDQISEQVMELDDMRQHGPEQAHPATILLELLDKLQLQETNSRELRQLKIDIGQLKPGDDAGQIYEQVVTLLNNSLVAGDEAAPVKTRKQKLLDRIMLRQEKAREQNETEENATKGQPGNGAEKNERSVSQKLMAPAVGDLLLQLALRMPDVVKRRINFLTLKQHTNRARQRKDLIAIVDVIAQHVDAAYAQEQLPVVMLDEGSAGALAQAVQQLIRQMNPPGDLQQRIAELEKFYSDGCNDIESLIHCLNSLAEVVAEICSRFAQQRDELDRFFVKLGMRLEDLDIGLQKAGRLTEDSQQGNLQMNKAVHNELRSIQDLLQSTSDLVQLKTGIRSRLDIIDQHLLQFHDAEKQRYEQAQKTILELGEKISVLGTDSKQLQSCLEENRKQAMHDVLTGIPNRQAYEERLASEVARCKRYGTAMSLVVWDVDKFKAINDNYSRAGGDRVLRAVADLLRGHVRETDFVARYDGEVFVTLLPQTTADAAMQVADKLRTKIEETPFQFHDTRIVVTLSAGIAQYRKDELVNSLFDRADTALNAAKEAGHNQVKSAED